jgi:hypothetical protein
MRSTCTTAQGLSILIGRRGLYSTSPFAFPVEVLDAKIGYGNLRLFVTPVGGSGECWVDASKVRLLHSVSPCPACAEHYGDSGTCDEGKPLASPHRAEGIGPRSV